MFVQFDIQLQEVQPLTSLAVQCVFLHLLAVQLLATSTLTRRVITYIIIQEIQAHVQYSEDVQHVKLCET